MVSLSKRYLSKYFLKGIYTIYDLQITNISPESKRAMMPLGKSKSGDKLIWFRGINWGLLTQHLVYTVISLYIGISLKYTTVNTSRYSRRASLIWNWNETGALISRNNRTWYPNCPWWVLKAVLHSFSLWIQVIWYAFRMSMFNLANNMAVDRRSKPYWSVKNDIYPRQWLYSTHSTQQTVLRNHRFLINRLCRHRVKKWKSRRIFSNNGDIKSYIFFVLFHDHGYVINLATIRYWTGVYSTAYAVIGVSWIVVAHLCLAMKSERTKRDQSLLMQ